MQHELSSTQTNPTSPNFITADDLDGIQKALMNRPVMGSETEFGPFMAYLRHGHDIIHKGLSREGAGMLMPHSVWHKVERDMAQLSPMRSVCRTHTVYGDHLELISDMDRAEVGWMQGEKQVDETKLPSWHKQIINLHTLYAKPCISQQLLDDAAFNLEDWLSQRISEQMARIENKAFTSGHGLHQPSGILSAATAHPGKGSDTSIEQVETGYQNFVNGLMDTMHLLASEYTHGAVWMMNRSSIARIKRLHNPSTGHCVWQPSLALGTPETLLGHSIVVNDDLDGRMIFGNFAHAYQIVDRADVHVLRDPYSAKPFVEFFATKRVGGGVIQPSALKFLSIRDEVTS